MLVSRDEERTDEHNAGDDPERVYCTPGRWSPHALVHTVPHGRPNDVWGLVLPGEVATAVVVWLKVTWLNGS